MTFPGVWASVGLSALAVALVAVLDPAGRWPLGLVNVAAFGAVIGLGWAAARRKNPSAPAILSWGAPNIEARAGGLVALGVILSAWGGGFLLGELGNLMVRLWPLPTGLARALNRLLDLSQPAAVLVPLMLVAPLTEETLFRGLMLPSLARRYGRFAGVALTSLLFAAVHLNPWQGAAALVAGAYLGELRLRTGGLALPLAAHSLFNGLPLATALAGLPIDGYNTAYVVGTAQDIAWPWLAAGAGALAVGLPLSFGLRLFQRPVF